MDRFAYLQNLPICKLRFALSVYANFVYTQKWKNCIHMDRFAYVSKICIYAKFACVSKSGHVNGTLVTRALLEPVLE